MTKELEKFKYNTKRKTGIVYIIPIEDKNKQCITSILQLPINTKDVLANDVFTVAAEHTFYNKEMVIDFINDKDKKLVITSDFKLKYIITDKNLKKKNYTKFRNKSTRQFVISSKINEKDLFESIYCLMKENYDNDNKDVVIFTDTEVNTMHIDFQLAMYNKRLSKVYEQIGQAIMQAVDVKKFSLALNELVGDDEFEKLLKAFELDEFEDLEKLLKEYLS